MKNKLIIILYFLSASFIQAQVTNNTSLEELSKGLNEKSVLITDRDLYLSGENICFKIYNLINESILDTDFSKVVYVEIFNSQQSIIKEKFNIQNSFTDGIIHIPDEIISGNYFIRTYTKYQRNLVPESLFTQTIRIINPSTPILPIEINPNLDLKTATIEGNLETSKESKIVYFIQPYLIQSSQNICLINNEDECIQILKPKENGLGEITFTPNNTAEYFIKIKFKDGKSVQKALSKSTNPLQIKTFKTNEILRVNIGLQEGLQPSFINDSLKMLVLSPSFQQKGASRFKLISGMKSIIIAQDILETGINYLVIKDKNGSVLKIHPVFKNSKQSLNLQIKPDKSTYSRRELVNIQLSLPESLKNSSADLSIAVLKKGNRLSSHHLPSYILENPLLLNSWVTLNLAQNNLQTEIYLLLYLFETELNNTKYHSFFENKKPSEIFWLPETKGVSLSGMVRNKVTKKGQANINVIASTLGNDAQTHFTETAEDGSFVFALKNLNKQQSVSLKMPDYETENLEFFIHKDFAELPSFRNNTLWIGTQDEKTLNEMYFNYQSQHALDGFQISATPKPKFTSVSWISDTTIYMKDYIQSENMEQLIDEILPFVHAREINGNYSISIQDKEITTTYSNPFILLDNYPISNLNAFLKLNPKAIEKVSINYTPYHHGISKLNGIISFFTKTADFAGYPTTDASVFINYQTAGISQKRSFNHYDNKLKLESTKPDFRNLLFWEPEFKFQNPATLSFYTSDNISEYEIIVRGISENGQIITGRASINIVR
jgi:hypothetical protein